MNSTKNISENGVIAPLPTSPSSDNQNKILQLKSKIEKLNKICEEINPYVELDISMQLNLKELGILDFSNPFHITNTLVVLLEDAINELHQLSPFEIDFEVDNE